MKWKVQFELKEKIKEKITVEAKDGGLNGSWW